MMRSHRSDIAISQGPFAVKLAVKEEEREAAFRLRFEVFNLELGEGLPESNLTGMDKDVYDDYCDHLVVIDSVSEKVVGTYRMMPGVVAENSIGFYSETEFDLTSIRSLSDSKLELGRSCVHKDFRNAFVIGLLWRGIASYIDHYDIRHLFGCGSLHSSNPAEISIVYSYLNRFHRADERYKVQPLRRLRDVQMFSFCDREQAFSAMPPLMKGYLRLGAQVCGEPAYDHVFGTTDFLILLDTEKLVKRYQKRFFSEEQRSVCAA